MMFADVNVLIGAFRSDSQHHSVARPWLDHLLLSDVAFGVAPLALAGVMRITMNPKIFFTPSSASNVLAFCQTLLSHKRAVRLEAGKLHWEIFVGICSAMPLKSDLVTDAWYAALAIEHDCEIVTFDRDFARFPGLRWKHPS